MKYVISLLFAALTLGAFAEPDTLYHAGKDDVFIEWKHSTALFYMARFDLQEPVYLNSIEIKLAGSGSGTLRIFGQEGGSPYAELEKDLIDPIEFTKESGKDYVRIDLEDSILLDNNQFFVTIDISNSDLKVLIVV